MEPNENQIIIVDEDGVEYAMEIYFTYDNEDRGCHYVLCYDKETPEDILAFRYGDDDNSLEEVVDDDELDEIEEVLNALQDDPKILNDDME